MSCTATDPKEVVEKEQPLHQPSPPAVGPLRTTHLHHPRPSSPRGDVHGGGGPVVGGGGDAVAGDGIGGGTRRLFPTGSAIRHVVSTGLPRTRASECPEAGTAPRRSAPNLVSGRQAGRWLPAGRVLNSPRSAEPPEGEHPYTQRRSPPGRRRRCRGSELPLKQDSGVESGHPAGAPLPLFKPTKEAVMVFATGVQRPARLRAAGRFSPTAVIA